MPITIVEDIGYNNRNYNIGQLTLTDSDLNAQTLDDHPLGRLVLKYLASPISTENYDDIEDNLLYFLKPSFIETLSEEDSEVKFDKEEYLQHLAIIKDKLFAMTMEELLTIIANNYAGANKKEVSMALSQTGLTDKGKAVTLEDINTELGTDHVLSAHTTGIEGKKIYQAASQRFKYEPALDRINDLLEKIEDNDPDKYFKLEILENVSKTKIKLPGSEKLQSFNESKIMLEINFEALFHTLFEEAGINPTSNKLNKADEITRTKEYIPKYEMNSNEETIIHKLNLKREMNAVIDEYKNSYNELLDEVDIKNLGDKDIAESILSDKDKTLKTYAENMYSEGLWSGKKLSSFYSGDKDLQEFKFSIPNEKEENLLKKILAWKTDNDMEFTDFELEIQDKFSRKTQRKITISADRRTSPILHASKESTTNSDRKMFKDFSGKLDMTTVLDIDLKNAAKHSREIKEMLDEHALIPLKVGKMDITLSVVFANEEEIDRRNGDLDEEDNDIRENAKYLLDEIYNIYRLENVSFKATRRYDLGKDWTERRPQAKIKWDKRKKYAFDEPRIRREKTKDSSNTFSTEGQLASGGQPVNVQVKTNTLIYYMKRQMANLVRVLNG